jgi:saccharopine dehydrogenase-like NADP-dependent oxidoreductase
VLIELGYTDDVTLINHLNTLTFSQLTEALLPTSSLPMLDKLQHFLKSINSEECLDKLLFLGITDNTSIPLQSGTPADVLQSLLLKNWSMMPDDKDLVVMKHEFEYLHEGVKKHHDSTLYIKGENAEHTAMAKTVGLPAAIFCTLILENKVSQTGVLRPLHRECFPILTQLENHGIVFEENVY